MEIVASGVLAGVLGTVAMDALNHLFSRNGMLLKIDVGAIGRRPAVTGLGRCVRRRDDSGLLVLRPPLHGIRRVRQALS